MTLSAPEAPIMVLLPVPPASKAGPDPEATAVDLVRAVMTSDLWLEIQPASVGVSLGTPQQIGFVGRFDEAALNRLGALRWQLEHAWPHLRFVGYAEAEAAAERLAAALVERFGDAALAGFRFTAIPRGGLIVLGMVAYALGLTPGQLDDDPDDRVVRVVIDDCAISGDRFRRLLRTRPRWTRVVFAPLFSTPELRAAVRAGETERVLGVVSGVDLVDRAPSRQGDDYAAWVTRWSERRTGMGYWIGQPDPICFAWNEPDFGFWNPGTAVSERAWSLVPPEHCLKNRRRTDPDARVDVTPLGAGPLAPADGVVAITFEGQVFIGRQGWPAPLALGGVAADLWRELVRSGDAGAAAVAIATTYGADVATVRSDLELFVTQLLAAGALVVRP